MIEDVLAERGKRYGEFKDHAELSQTLKMCMYEHEGWKRLSLPQRESLEMVMHKIARIINGDPNYKDSWTDIIGYVKLIEQELQ